MGSSSPYESNRASPTGGRRPLPFKRDLMGLSLSLSKPYILSCNGQDIVKCISGFVTIDRVWIGEWIY
jgi:hypothetical protein